MRELTRILRERHPTAARASSIVTHAAHFWLRPLGIGIAVAVFLALTGVFGSYRMPLIFRLGYWLPVMIACTLAAVVIIRLVETRGWQADRPWAQAVLSTIVLSPLLSVIVWGMNAIYFQSGLHIGLLAGIFPQVLVIAAAMSAINVLGDRKPVETHAAAPGAAPPRFVERLPFKLRGAAIRAVEAQDHYLRVHTAAGDTPILMRLSDALAELEGLEGARTHRSWWVARDAVTGARRGDGRAVLILEGGIEAPVSRSFARALRDTGWF